MAEYFIADEHRILLFIAGCMAIMAAIIPVILRKRHISEPIVYILIGGIVYFVSGYRVVKPLEQLEEIKYITEFVILVALTNAGLRIKEPFKWQTWKHSFRLLIIAMPITIAAAALLGWWIIGLAPAAALLFGALISPTDPVLASELQTSEPGEEDTSKVKLGLTSEAGVNDGLAFPFTYFAILFVTNGADYKDWIGEWFLHFFLMKIIIGVSVGLLSGWLLYKLVFTISNKNTIGRISRGILSLSLILLPYSISEIIGGMASSPCSSLHACSVIMKSISGT
ncbi:hypothetical protein HYN59_13105 [Flavobacterium album]|uniref:Cation/H+ exchanger transmembrane domain-containing protein n=1 Tax=Flavobacterium album TaxID=2175091 RepID=A0A2S1QZY2_9FLAO|nr:cation:proton antiporter [Flavobacterium album]AWH85987.1 hypothetical protein HYN59_13105 [Flavobacterium album]